MTVLSLPPGISSRFTAQSQLHRGRLGIAYRARSADGAEGVLRLLDTSLCRSAPDRVRLTRELQKLTTVIHPGLVVPSEIGEDGGQLWYFRPFIEGESLADWMARGPMHVDQALGLGGQVADALHALHRAGLLHRDLCPERILLGADGRVVLVDAVVAAPVDDDHERVFGTAPFVSPEEVDGKPTSFRSDLYSLGMVLYSALVGEPPFEGPTAKVLDAHLNQVPAPLDVELSAEARGLLDQLLDKEPRCRPFSAQKVAKTLSQYVPQALRAVEKSVAVPSAPPPPRTPKGTLLGVQAMMPPSVASSQAVTPVVEPPTVRHPSFSESSSDSGAAWLPTRTLLGMPSPGLPSQSASRDDTTQPLQLEQVVEAREVHAPATDVTPAEALGTSTATLGRPDPTEPVGFEQIVEVRPSHPAPPAWPAETSSSLPSSTLIETATSATLSAVGLDDTMGHRAVHEPATTELAPHVGSDEFPLSTSDFEDTENDGSSTTLIALRTLAAPLAHADASVTDPLSATLTAPLPGLSGPTPPPLRRSVPPLPPRTSVPPALPPRTSAPPLSGAPAPLASFTDPSDVPSIPAPSLAPPSLAPPSSDGPALAAPGSASTPKKSGLKRALLAATLLFCVGLCAVGGWILTQGNEDVAGSPPAAAAGTGTITASAPPLDAGVVALQAPDSGPPDLGPADFGPPDVGVLDTGVLDVGVLDLGAPDSGAPREFTAEELTFMRGPIPRGRDERARWLALRRAAEASSMMGPARDTASNPNSPSRVQERARAATAAGNHAEATQLYEQLTRTSPSSASAWFALGQSRMRQRNGRGAAAALQTATTLSPRNATYWAMLGAARRNSGDAAGARTAFQQALRIDPNNQTAQRGLAP